VPNKDSSRRERRATMSPILPPAADSSASWPTARPRRGDPPRRACVPESEPVTLPAAWTGEGHVLAEPWIAPELLDNLGALLRCLDQHNPAGLASKREEFRTYGQRPGRHEAFTQLLEARAELVVAGKLLRAGAGLKIRKDTRAFDCQINGQHFGVEVTTRARDDVDGILRARKSPTLTILPSSSPLPSKACSCWRCTCRRPRLPSPPGRWPIAGRPHRGRLQALTDGNPVGDGSTKPSHSARPVSRSTLSRPTCATSTASLAPTAARRQ
jgi:hypothetical protein